VSYENGEVKFEANVLDENIINSLDPGTIKEDDGKKTISVEIPLTITKADWWTETKNITVEIPAIVKELSLSNLWITDDVWNNPAFQNATFYQQYASGYEEAILIRKQDWRLNYIWNQEELWWYILNSTTDASWNQVVRFEKTN